MRTARSHVYFMRSVAGDGAVKIGYSLDPQGRVGHCQCLSPVKLMIVAQLPGGATLEGRFHAKFKAQHSHAEWFHPSAVLERTIAEIAAGVFDVSTLPLERWSARLTRKGSKWSDAQRAAHQATMASRRADRRAARKAVA